MLGVKHNQHRWRNSVDNVTLATIERGAKRLAVAWKKDMESPNRYPLSTSIQLVEFQDLLRKSRRNLTGSEVWRRPRPPKTFADLVPDATIKVIYEDQNQERYEDAIKRATLGFAAGLAAWQKISRAAEGAYVSEYYGIEFTPKPRVHFLHRNLLLAVAASEELRDLSPVGVAEFLDDNCPCGKSHQPDAIRKLKKRFLESRSEKH